MSIYYISCLGADGNNGLSPASPWRTLARLAEAVAAEMIRPGDSVLLRGGDTFQGSISWFRGGDPLLPITLSRYGSSRPTVRSGMRHGLWYSGDGGMIVRGIDFVGDATSLYGTTSGIEVSAAEGGPCRNILIEDVSCTEYSFAGILLSTSLPLWDCSVRNCRLVRNANGLLTSAGDGSVDSRGIFGLTLSGILAEDNDWVGDGSENPIGHGISLYNVSGLSAEYCRLLRNGTRFIGNPGHSGFILYNCDHAVIRFCEAIDNGDPSTWGDGQGFVVDQCQDVLIEHNFSRGNLNGGFQVMTVTPPGRSQRVTVRNCVSLDDVVGLSVYGESDDIYFLNNQVRTHSRDGVFRKCADVSPGTGDVIRFWGNRFTADDGAVLLQVTGERGLRGVSGFPANEWVSADPQFLANDAGYATLGELLAAVPVELSP